MIPVLDCCTGALTRWLTVPLIGDEDSGVLVTLLLPEAFR
jgi:hypothetical protein